MIPLLFTITVCWTGYLSFGEITPKIIMFSPKRCVFYTVIIPLNIVRALYLFVIINLIGLQSRGLKDALSMFFMNKNEFL